MEYTPNFPTNLDSFKKFVSDHLFNVDQIDDEICVQIISKVKQGIYTFEPDEIRVMQSISNIGDVCTCDTDHRIGEDCKEVAVSGT